MSRRRWGEGLKYKTKEEYDKHHRERMREFFNRNPTHRREYHKAYYARNRKGVLARVFRYDRKKARERRHNERMVRVAQGVVWGKGLKYKTEAEYKAHRREYLKVYYLLNYEKMKTYQVKYNRERRQRDRETDNRFYNSPAYVGKREPLT